MIIQCLWQLFLLFGAAHVALRQYRQSLLIALYSYSAITPLELIVFGLVLYYSNKPSMIKCKTEIAKTCVISQKSNILILQLNIMIMVVRIIFKK